MEDGIIERAEEIGQKVCNFDHYCEAQKVILELLVKIMNLEAVVVEEKALNKFLMEAHSSKIQVRAAKAQKANWDKLPEDLKNIWRKAARKEMGDKMSGKVSGFESKINRTYRIRRDVLNSIFALIENARCNMVTHDEESLILMRDAVKESWRKMNDL